MKPSYLRHLSLSLFPLALGLGACVDDNADSGMIILRAVAPEAGCMFPAEADLFVPSGHIDVAAATGYLVGPEVRNDLTLADGEARTPKTIFVSGAKIEIAFYQDDVFSAAEQATLTADGLTRFVAPVAGSIEPAGGTAVFPFEAVPTELLTAIGEKLQTLDRGRTLLDVKIRMVGTRGGSSVESNLFRFPVEVCANCGIQNLGDCTGVSTNQVIATGGVCQPFQDGHVDCCNGVDPDSLEVDCPTGMLPADAPAGATCQDNVDEPQPLICPARPPEL